MKFSLVLGSRAKFSHLLLLPAILLLLSGCQDHRDNSIETFGQIDSSLIAADTTMQANMDRSYEFQRTLAQNDTVVYDFTAYDKPKGASSPDWESKFIVIRRTSSSSDTIIKDMRSGLVQNIWLSDMNENGKPEIMFYEYPKYNAKTAEHFLFYAYEVNGRAKAKKIESDFNNDGHYRGRDSFYVSDDLLIRAMPYYEKKTDSISSGMLWQSYKLSDGRLIMEKEKRVLK